MNRQPVLAISIAVGTVIAAAPLQAEERLNIILIQAQGLSGSLPGFGGGRARTPYLDGLAIQSVTFRRYYVVTPQAAPSQAVLLTGQYPHVSGVTADNMSPGPRADSLATRLKKAGYTCGLVGRWHLPWRTADKKVKVGFGLDDYTALVEDSCGWRDCKGYIQGQPVQITEYVPDWEMDRAIEFIEKSAKAPFFLWLASKAPDQPQEYAPGEQSLYAQVKLDLPTAVNMQSWPAILSGAGLVRRFHALDEAAWREAVLKHMCMVTRLDRNIGRLLHRLNETGLASKTVVIFTSDHGVGLGKHEMFGCGPAFFDEFIRVPLLVRLPGPRTAAATSSNSSRPPPATALASVPKPLSAFEPAGFAASTQPKPPAQAVAAGRARLIVETVVSQIDVAPTLCELAGLSQPLAMQGNSLGALLRDPQADRVGGEAFLEYEKYAPPGGPETAVPVRGIVSREYKLIDYLSDKDLFYDLNRDPEETSNALGDALDEITYRPVVKVLRQRLHQWRRQLRDPVPVRE